MFNEQRDPPIREAQITIVGERGAGGVEIEKNGKSHYFAGKKIPQCVNQEDLT